MEQIIEHLRSVCQSYLAGEILRDDFGSDHAARRNWRTRMAQTQGEAFTLRYERNRLRLNNIAAVYSFLETLAYMLDQYGVQCEEADLVRKLNADRPNLEGYNEMPDEGKLAIVAKMDEIARSFLELTKDYHVAL